MNKMNIVELVELLPDSVKLAVIDFQLVKMKSGEIGTRITLDRILTDVEKTQMVSERFRGLDCIAQHKYAPEIKCSYFYII